MKAAEYRFLFWNNLQGAEQISTCLQTDYIKYDCNTISIEYKRRLFNECSINNADEYACEDSDFELLKALQLGVFSMGCNVLLVCYLLYKLCHFKDLILLWKLAKVTGESPYISNRLSRNGG